MWWCRKYLFVPNPIWLLRTYTEIFDGARPFIYFRRLPNCVPRITQSMDVAILAISAPRCGVPKNTTTLTLFKLMIWRNWGSAELLPMVQVSQKKEIQCIWTFSSFTCFAINPPMLWHTKTTGCNFPKDCHWGPLVQRNSVTRSAYNIYNKRVQQISCNSWYIYSCPEQVNIGIDVGLRNSQPYGTYCWSFWI